MNFITTTSTFLSELSAVIGAADKSSSIPVLQNVLIDVADKVTLAATNLDHRLTTAFDGEIKVQGALLVNAAKLYQILKSLNKSAEIEVRGERDTLRLKCERGNFKLAGLGTEHFPAAQSFKAEAIDLPAEVFKRALAGVSHAITNDESRYALAGAKLELLDARARLIATDGHRLALAEFQLESLPPQVATIIPGAALTLLQGLLDGAQVCSFEHSENGLRFTAGNRSLETRTLTGAFPNYELVLPKWQTIDLRCEADELAARLARVSPVADKAKNSNRSMRCELKPGALHLITREQHEEAEEVLPVEFNETPFSIGFAIEYLQDACRVLAGKEIVIGFKDGNSQVRVTPAEKDGLDVTLVIMPMRL